MNTRTQLRKSLLIAPAEQALRRAETVAELEDCWFDFADGFADDAPERKQLLAVYLEQLPIVRKREADAKRMASYLRAI